MTAMRHDRMTTAGEAMRAHTELERRYRRLLLAYPLGYRRAYRDEILATLMDAAEPGRRKPARADTLDLLRGAIRQWFRLPPGWPVRVAAVLTALIIGAMGAAGGSLLAWETAAAPLPPDGVALRATEMLAGAALPAPVVDRQGSWRAQRAVQVTNHDVRGFPGWTLAAAQGRLRADGWTITRSEEFSTGFCTACYTLLATRNGHVLSGVAHTPRVPAGSATTVGASFSPATPGWEPGAMLPGWLLGAVAGWLLTGWAADRLRRRALPLRAAAATLAVAALWSGADATQGLYRMLADLARTEPEPAFPSYGYVTGHPEQIGLTLALAAAVLALAVTGRRRPTQPAAATA